MNPPDQPLIDVVRGELEDGRVAGFDWQGGFGDYLDLVARDPLLARNAWQRMLDMLEHWGSDGGRRPSEPRRWRIFDDPFDGGRDAVYGIDRSLDELVQTIRAGASGHGPERRILLLHGPVGSSKSTIARLLKRGLEHYSRLPS